jgi:hypothetical protein
MSVFKALVMAVVLLALGAYVYFVELPHDREETAKKKLFTFDKSAVAEVHLAYPDRSLHLKKDAAGKWRLTQPINTEADETAVTNIVNAIADAEISRILEEPGPDLALYGLNAPVVKIHVTLKDGKTLPQVLIGKDTPIGYSVYLQKEGETKILLTPQAFRLGMTKEVKDLRDKTILAFQPEDVKKIALQGPTQEIVLAKTDSSWRLEKPVSGKAEETQVQTLLSTLHTLRAQDFVEQSAADSPDYGLTPPQFTVALTVGADNTTKTLLIGGEKAQDKASKLRYLKRGEHATIFLAAESILHDVNKSVEDLRDKTISRFSQEQATRVEVTRQDGLNFTLTRGADKKWTIDKTGDGVFKEIVASQLISALADFRGYEVAADNPADLAAYGLTPPLVTIAVYDEKNTKLAAILAGQTKEKGAAKTYVITEGGKTVFVVRDYIFERLHKAPADFWGLPAEQQTNDNTAAEPSSAATSATPKEEDLPETEEGD